VRGAFAPDSVLRIAPETLTAGAAGKLRVRIDNRHGRAALHGVRISLACVSGTISIALSSRDSEVEMQAGSSGYYDLRLWRRSRIVVGRDTTANGVRIICDDSEVEIGDDCMFSDEVLVQAADQHPIVDLKSGKVINNQRRRTVLGAHVWVGRGAVLMPDVKVGRGAIVGTGAIVTQDVPATSVVVGVPARVVREDTTWSRQFGAFDDQAAGLLAEFRSRDN
jgi:acetyltransferase-like isoleucine patch superfamily enzyme